MLVSALEELAIFLPPPLLMLCQEVAYLKGGLLFAAGQRPDHMYFVVQGEVVLERPSNLGALVTLQKTRRGFVGEASLKSTRYHCDGRVVASAKLIQIPIAAMRSAMDTDPAFSGRWISMLNSEVKRLRLRCERLSLPKLKDRLVHLIETEGDAGRYWIGAGMKALASELGVTHEALYRCVSSMTSVGLLERSPDSICFLPLAKISDAKRARPSWFTKTSRMS